MGCDPLMASEHLSSSPDLVFMGWLDNSTPEFGALAGLILMMLSAILMSPRVLVLIALAYTFLKKLGIL